jgi:hypothetical protein
MLKPATDQPDNVNVATNPLLAAFDQLSPAMKQAIASAAPRCASW